MTSGCRPTKKICASGGEKREGKYIKIDWAKWANEDEVVVHITYKDRKELARLAKDCTDPDGVCRLHIAGYLRTVGLFDVPGTQGEIYHSCYCGGLSGSFDPPADDITLGIAPDPRGSCCKKHVMENDDLYAYIGLTTTYYKGKYYPSAEPLILDCVWVKVSPIRAEDIPTCHFETPQRPGDYGCVPGYEEGENCFACATAYFKDVSYPGCINPEEAICDEGMPCIGGVCWRGWCYPWCPIVGRTCSLFGKCEDRELGPGECVEVRFSREGADDSGAELPYGRANICLLRCATDRDCPPWFRCEGTRCLPGEPCDYTKKGWCVYAGPGAWCTSDEDCLTGICVGGRCQGDSVNRECESDLDCPSGYVCVNGECVYEGGDGEKKEGISWWWIALGIGIVFLIVLLSKRKKKRRR